MDGSFKTFLSDPVLVAVLDLFQPRFARAANVIWLNEGMAIAPIVDNLAAWGMRPKSICNLPNVVFYEPHCKQTVAVDVVGLRGQMTQSRCDVLKSIFLESDLNVIPVSAFADRSEFRGDVKLPWSSVAWFANEPDHLMQFDGPFLGAEFSVSSARHGHDILSSRNHT